MSPCSAGALGWAPNILAAEADQSLLREILSEGKRRREGKKRHEKKRDRRTARVELAPPCSRRRVILELDMEIKPGGSPEC